MNISISIGLDDEGRLITIPLNKEEPIIGIIGRKRHGMSCIAKRLSYHYYKAGYKVVNLNDRIEE